MGSQSDVNGFGAFSLGIEGRGCWGLELGEERHGQNEILCRGEQKAGLRNLLVPEDQGRPVGTRWMRYGPEPRGVVMASTEFAFLFCMLKFLQIFSQSRKPHGCTALGATEDTESICAVRKTIQMENEK